jgi:hypothetical protein
VGNGDILILICCFLRHSPQNPNAVQIRTLQSEREYRFIFQARFSCLKWLVPRQPVRKNRDVLSYAAKKPFFEAISVNDTAIPLDTFISLG